MRKSRIASFVAIGVVGCVGSTTAQAQALDDKYWVQLSGYWAKVDTDIRVDNTANDNPGTEIDLEDDLGFDDKEFLPALFAGARVGSGISIAAEYYSLNRDTTATLARDIIVDDVTYPATASVTAGFDTDIYRLTVGWAFARGDNYEFGAAIGLHATDLGISFEGEGSVGGGTVSVQQRKEDVLAPLPTVGLFGAFEAADNITIGGRIDYLSLSIDDYDGRLINAQASVSYRFTPNFGVGVMYRYVDYRVDVTKNDVEGRFAYEFSGPAIFLEAGF